MSGSENEGEAVIDCQRCKNRGWVLERYIVVPPPPLPSRPIDRLVIPIRDRYAECPDCTKAAAIASRAQGRGEMSMTDWKSEYEAEHEKRLADKVRIASLEAELAERTFANTQLAVIGVQQHDRIRELEAALLRYGYHEPECNFIQNELPCTCGFEALRTTVDRKGEP